MHRTRIKICGLTRRDDVAAAVAAGVDALGFVFYPASKRYVVPAAAAELLAAIPAFVSSVGLSDSLAGMNVKDLGCAV